MLAIAALLAIHAGFAGSIPTAPENITVTFLTPTSVRVSWQTSMDPHTLPVDKYDVTYKPTDASYRVVVVVAGNRDAVTLGGLTPDTQYQLSVAAVWNGKRYRSRPIVFRTLEPPRTSYQLDSGSPAGSSGPPNSPHADTAPSLSGIGIFNDEFGNMSVNSTSRELPTIRGVEIGIVVLVLIVWAGAIALFFNRWGKIRMLLPYQPDYKQEQLKVPGTGVCANGTCNGQHSHQRRFSEYPEWETEDSTTGTNVPAGSGNARRKKSLKQDSIEMVECHKEPVQVTVPVPPVPTVTPGAVPVVAGTTATLITVGVPIALAPSKVITIAPNAITGNSIVGSAAVSSINNTINSTSNSGSTVGGNATGTTAIVVKPTPKLSNLPTLSVSGPSPPHEEEFLL
uniref:Fibronectin type-III domain-containing protein n=1 Tax=Anopheles atroparvus TaxID=41427 RepID=A0AAG5DFG3_ANOAO